jgi:hypothetical protein
MKTRLAFEAAVPEKVVIDGSVGSGETQTRGKSVLELLADKFGVGLFGFHEAQRGEANSSQPTANSERRRRDTENTEAGAQRAQRREANSSHPTVDAFDHGQG